MAPAPARQGVIATARESIRYIPAGTRTQLLIWRQIRKWWTKTPNANIGIPTGEKSDWLVLDVDDGGDETISALEATYGKLPDTVTAVTGSGGWHYVLNTLKAGVSQIRPSLHRVLIPYLKFGR